MVPVLELFLLELFQNVRIVKRRNAIVICPDECDFILSNPERRAVMCILGDDMRGIIFDVEDADL